MKALNKLLYISFLTGALMSCSEDEDAPPTPFVPSSENKILKFTVDDQEGIIDNEQNTITVNVDTYYYSDFCPTIELSGGRVEPRSGECRTLDNKLKYTTSAEDGSTREYELNIKTELPNLVIDTLSDGLIYERGQAIDIRGNHFLMGWMTARLYNETISQDLEWRQIGLERLIFQIGHDIPLGKYLLEITDSDRILIYEHQITVEVESPQIQSINTSSVIRGETFEITGQFFASDLSNNAVFLDEDEMEIVAANSTSLTVKVPSDFTIGDHQLSVTSNGKTTIGDLLTVVVDPNAPVITDINSFSFTLGETMILSGNNFENDSDVATIHFIPFTSGTDQVVTATVINNGTQVQFTFPDNFIKGTYTFFVEVDSKYGLEYDEAILIE